MFYIDEVLLVLAYDLKKRYFELCAVLNLLDK